MTELLRIRDLQVSFDGHDGTVHAVNGVDLEVPEGATVAVVGESGSGKTVTALSVLGLLPSHADVGGSITFAGQELVGESERVMRRVRGGEIAMVFQDPMTSLNPVMTVGRQLGECLREHVSTDDATVRARALELLDQVGMPDPERQATVYPHQLSGGLRQRVMIAMALAGEPRLVIADEPTTALDVTIQAQILDLLRDLIADRGTALLLITHDLGVVAGTCRRASVMYGGRVVEEGAVDTLFAHPRHPYTVGLLGSIPRPELPAKQRLQPIAGRPPQLRHAPTNCSFAPRCPHVQADCRERVPLLERRGNIDHEVACLHPVESTPWVVST